MRFPYYLAPGQPRSASVPFIKVVYKNHSKFTTPLLALVDSGASVSFAPLDIALWLGIRVDTKKSLDIRGFNDAVTSCYQGITTIEIEGHDFDMPVYFGGKSNLQILFDPMGFLPLGFELRSALPF